MVAQGKHGLEIGGLKFKFDWGSCTGNLNIFVTFFFKFLRTTIYRYLCYVFFRTAEKNRENTGAGKTKVECISWKGE